MRNCLNFLSTDDTTHEQTHEHEQIIKYNLFFVTGEREGEREKEEEEDYAMKRDIAHGHNAEGGKDEDEDEDKLVCLMLGRRCVQDCWHCCAHPALTSIRWWPPTTLLVVASILSSSLTVSADGE